jgi:hypothetical protein
VSEWVSVKERLPEDSKKILLYHQDGRTLFGLWSNRKEGWYFDSFGPWEKDEVTHWMPLPEPPKEGE